MKNLIGFMCTNYSLFVDASTGKRLANDLDGYFERGDYITSAFTSAYNNSTSQSTGSKKKYILYTAQPGQDQREYNGSLISPTMFGQQ
jgi:hypothetical protein